MNILLSKNKKSTTAAYSKLQMFGSKTCHLCIQLEHVFFFTCICLGVTNGSCEHLIIKNKAFSLWCSLLEFLLSNVLIMYDIVAQKLVYATPRTRRGYLSSLRHRLLVKSSSQRWSLMLVNLPNTTWEERRQQTLCDKHNNNFVWNNFSP